MIGWLAYTPFLDPLPWDSQVLWLLMLLPLVVVVSVVYKTIKLPDLKELPRQAGMLTVQIVVFMVLAACVLWLLTELV